MNDQIAMPLAQFISQKIIKQPNKVIQPDEPLITSGLVDSFSLVDLALFVENSFNVRIDDTELTADVFDTLRQLAELVESRLPR